MESFLREYRWVLNLGLIAVAAFLLATILNRVVASQIAPMTVPKTPSWTVSQPDKQASEAVNRADIKRWDDALSERCPFGCGQQADEPKTCPGGCEEGEVCQEGVCVPTEPQQEQQVGSDVPVESDINVKLLGCMVADNSEYSLALMQDGESQQTFVVSVGDQLPGGARIVRITRDRVFLKRNGQTEYVRLDKTIGGDPSPVSIKPSRRSAPSPAANSGGSAGGSARAPEPKARNLGAALRDLRNAADSENDGSGSTGNDQGNGLARQVDENRYELNRQKLEETLADPEKIARQGRMVDNYGRDGNRGVKMVGVSPGGLYSELGMQTGDVVTAINGEPVNNKRDARELLERLQGGGGVSVTIQRNGRTIERQYQSE